MTDQPSNAPTDLNDGAPPTDAREDATPAAVLSDDRADGGPGDGQIAPTGGASPNRPADAGISAGDAGASAEAIRRSTDETTR